MSKESQKADAPVSGWTREEIALRVAQGIPEGATINLGIGLPTLVANYFSSEREIIVHSENGLLGMGPAPATGQEDYDLINAGKQPVTAVPGASFFHQADSFAIMRGGHLDYCILGAYEVAVNGDLANWHLAGPDSIPAVGGAMDLAVGARQTYVMTALRSKDGSSKLVQRCSFPLTGQSCVKKVYTDLATFCIDSQNETFIVEEMAPGVSFQYLETLIPARLVDASKQ